MTGFCPEPQDEQVLPKFAFVAKGAFERIELVAIAWQVTVISKPSVLLSLIKVQGPPVGHFHIAVLSTGSERLAIVMVFDV